MTSDTYLICHLVPVMAMTTYIVTLILLLDVLSVDCYQKTLRKMVRNKSKMVQRPLNEPKNLAMPGLELQGNTVIHKKLKNRMFSSTIYANQMKSENRSSTISNNVSMVPTELRHPRDSDGAFLPITNTNEMVKDTYLFPPPSNTDDINNINVRSDENMITNESSFEVPTISHAYLPPIKKRKEIITLTENTIVIPERHLSKNSSSKTLMKRIFISNSVDKTANKKSTANHINEPKHLDVENGTVDYSRQGKGIQPAASTFTYKLSVNVFSCTAVCVAAADIDAQQQFNRMNIEPPWIPKNDFWSGTFNSRYEYLMRSPKWPSLKVILVPRTHVDSIWQKSFERYHNDTVNKIITNLVKKMQFYQNLTFTWNEVSHLSQWWISASPRSRLALRRLLRGGRLEITTGGWVEPDEATTHLFGLVHQLVEGHQWLKTNLNYTPSVAWLTNSVAHSPTMTYLLSAAGIKKLVITNLHYSWMEYLAEYQFSDFIWIQNWDQDKLSPTHLNSALNTKGVERLPKHSVATHIMQFNSAGFQACGPNKATCAINFDFTKANKILDVNSYNVKEKAELLLEQYSKSGTVSQHNVIMAPIGDPYRYENQPEFDYQYNNYQQLANFINVNQNIYKASIEFGTPKDYFHTIFKSHKSYPTVKGDFLNYADLTTGSPAYWTGYYTSRPLLKILLRRLESTLRSTEILFSFALSFNSFRTYYNTTLFETLLKARHTVARLSDRNVVSGTLTANAVKYVYRLILATVKDCWYLQEVATSLLSVKAGNLASIPCVHKYVYREGQFMSPFRTVQAGDLIYVFNSLSHERIEVVEVTVSNPNVRVIDHNKKELTIQINPIWKYTLGNTIRISRRFFKVIFTIVIPPVTLELYKIKSTYDASQSAATIYCVACDVDDVRMGTGAIFPFHIKQIQKGDIQLENYKHRLVFDENTGFLKSVVEKMTDNKKSVIIDYGAFKSSNKDSGMFLFNTNATKPIHDMLLDFRMGIKSKIGIIVTGQVTTEITNVFGTLLQHTVKVYNFMFGPLSNAIFIETTVDYEASPKNRELELFMSIQTDISNGNPPEIFTDNNGFQYTSRFLNLSRRIESNMYPMTLMAFMQDSKSRVTVITDHAQGVTSLQEGNLIVMLERRVLYNDGRGTDEGLADSSSSTHRHYLLLENIIDTSSISYYCKKPLHLPSLPAVHLTNSLNFILDLFIVGKKQTDITRYVFLPFVKTSFPCDVSLINYRVSLSRVGSRVVPSTALMILHRQSVSCNVEYASHVFCNGESEFSLDHILYNVKEIYQTNLVGTSNGIPITFLDQVNFPAMELTALKIVF